MASAMVAVVAVDGGPKVAAAVEVVAVEGGSMMPEAKLAWAGFGEVNEEAVPVLMARRGCRWDFVGGEGSAGGLQRDAGAVGAKEDEG